MIIEEVDIVPLTWALRTLRNVIDEIERRYFKDRHYSPQRSVIVEIAYAVVPQVLWSTLFGDVFDGRG